MKNKEIKSLLNDIFYSKVIPVWVNLPSAIAPNPNTGVAPK
jgi:hypothetical protein